MRFALALTALIVASGTVKASDYHALTGHLLKVYCQMGTCDWEQVTGVDSVGESAVGELFKVEANTWEGPADRKSPKGSPAKKTVSYVFCSRTKPAVLDASEGKWLVTEIAPGSPDTIDHSNSTAIGDYWLICHGIVAHDIWDIGKTLGQKLGYSSSVSGDTLTQKTIDQPAEMLTR